MNSQARPAGRGSIPAPGLLILTGASHTGKTTVASGVLKAVPPPAAFLSVDEVLQRTLRRVPGEIWSGIPLAYELIGAQLGILLDRGWFVVVESTFTYVPARGDGEFHSEALESLLAEAGSRDAPVLLVQLTAPENVVLERAEQTGRLDPSIVSATVALHGSATFPLSPEAIDTTALDAEESVARILDRLEGGA
jgi:autotransporter-associated beta strand protein